MKFQTVKQYVIIRLQLLYIKSHNRSRQYEQIYCDLHLFYDLLRAELANVSVLSETM